MHLTLGLYHHVWSIYINHISMAKFILYYYALAVQNTSAYGTLAVRKTLSAVVTAHLNSYKHCSCSASRLSLR